MRGRVRTLVSSAALATTLGIMIPAVTPAAASAPVVTTFQFDESLYTLEMCSGGPVVARDSGYEKVFVFEDSAGSRRAQVLVKVVTVFTNPDTGASVTVFGTFRSSSRRIGSDEPVAGNIWTETFTFAGINYRIRDPAGGVILVSAGLDRMTSTFQWVDDPDGPGVALTLVEQDGLNTPHLAHFFGGPGTATICPLLGRGRGF
jgi:hypothetical protein